MITEDQSRVVAFLSSPTTHAGAAAERYRGVIAVTRQADGSLTIGGAGTPVDWLRGGYTAIVDAVFASLPTAMRSSMVSTRGSPRALARRT